MASHSQSKEQAPRVKNCGASAAPPCVAQHSPAMQQPRTSPAAPSPAVWQSSTWVKSSRRRFETAAVARHATNNGRRRADCREPHNVAWQVASLMWHLPQTVSTLYFGRLRHIDIWCDQVDWKSARQLGTPRCSYRSVNSPHPRSAYGWRERLAASHLTAPATGRSSSYPSLSIVFLTRSSHACDATTRGRLAVGHGT